MTWTVRSVFPPNMLADTPIRANLGEILANCAHQLENFPHHRPFHVNVIRYGAFISPRNPLDTAAWQHELDGATATDDTLDELLAQLAAADGVDGSWAVSVFGEVVFEDGAE
jgi:hypothetical protein